MASCILSLFLAAAVGNSDCTILQFTADWCEPCKQMQPIISQLAQEGWDVRPVNTDREPQLVQQFRVENLPTLVILSGGREVDRIVGAVTMEQVKMRTDRVAARNGSGRSAAPPSSLSGAPAPKPNGPIVRGQSPGFMAAPRLAAGAAKLASGARSFQANNPALPADSAGPSPSLQLSPEQAFARAAAATVRIRVDEGDTTSFGSGTIIDTQGADALVLTCGHLFRGIDGTAKLSVDLFAGTPQEITIPAEVVDYNTNDPDIGLMSVRLPVRIEPIRLMPNGETLQIGQRVFSMGCDHGADPTRRDTQITNINRYVGAANIEIAGAPAVGRSGGGLFDLQGRLVGVCNAADAEDDEGIYAAGQVIFDQLQRINLAHLFDAAPSGLEGSASANVQLASSQAMPAAQPASFATPADEMPWPDETRSVPNLNSQASAAASSNRPSNQQLICIVREDGKDRVVTIDNPTPELLQTIQQHSR